MAPADTLQGVDRYGADVVIAGTGIAGALIAAKLRQAGVSVLMLEAADTPFFDNHATLLARYYESAVKTPNAPYPGSPEVPSPDGPDDYYVQGGGATFESSYTRIPGGTTYHWLGSTPRFLPADFRMRSNYGVAVDWPRLDDLGNWYKEAERQLGVSGDSAADSKARAGEPYPMPPIPLSYSDRRVRARLRDMKFDRVAVRVQSTPQARNSVPYGDRPACAGSSSCVPICPIQAKYDATVHLKEALRDGARLEPGWVVTEVVLDALGCVACVKGIRAGTRQPVTAKAKVYVLAMNAIEIPKVLLYSASRGHRVANSSGLVGCHLMDHDVKTLFGLAGEPLYPFRGPLSTAGIESLRDGAFRRRRAAFRVQLQNAGTSWAEGSPFTTLDALLKRGLIGDALRRRLAWDVSRQLELDALLEPLPEPSNRVTLAVRVDALGIPRPRLTYRRSEYTRLGAVAFERLARAILRRMGAKTIEIDAGYRASGHVLGTFRMGSSPHDSVVDSYGRTHDHPNLYLVGGGMFPTAGTANPTLTIAALALRAADYIRRQHFPDAHRSIFDWVRAAATTATTTQEG